MISAIQASATYNYLHVTDEQARHLAQLVRTLLDKKIRTIEPKEEDQAAWIEEILAGIPAFRAFQETCTPSVYNYEGQVTDSVQHNAFHPAGPLVYIERLRQWREDGSFKGFETSVEREDA